MRGGLSGSSSRKGCLPAGAQGCAASCLALLPERAARPPAAELGPPPAGAITRPTAQRRPQPAARRSPGARRPPARPPPLPPPAPLPQSASVTVTDSIVTVSVGVPDDVPTASMAPTTSIPATTFPNKEYWGGSCTPDGPLITKN